MVVRIGQKSARPRKTYFREWREYRGLTLEQLADRLDTGKSAVRKIEAGENKWNESTLYAWAEALSCEPTDLISRDPKAEDLRSLFEKAPEDTRNVILRLLKTG